MASRPTDRAPVAGRVDCSGRLVSADPELERLQCEAGSAIGEPLAIPQLAAVVRLAQQLKIPVARRVLAAADRQDIDMWVRAVPDSDEVSLSIDQWSAKPPSGPRLAVIAGTGQDLRPELCRWSVDEQLRLVQVSEGAAELLGVSAPDAAGQPLTGLVRLEANDSGEMPLLQALASRSAFSGQQVRRRSDDEPLVLSGELVLSPSGSFAGFDGSIRAPGEATSRAVAPEDPALNEVLRSPLRRIIDCADQMAEHSDGSLPTEYAAYAADISAAAHHLLSVVRSMSEDARSGRASLDLVELVYEAVGLMESGATERQIAIAVEPLETFSAVGERRGVIQILVNLISNAVRHSEEKATVTISFERTGGRAVVHVADDGPGIDPADQERIFQRFEQGKPGGQGTGLGLAIARRLARAMGGDILLESKPDAGSRFSLVLSAS